MKKLIFISFLFLTKFVSAQDCPQSLVEYEKLDSEKAKECFVLETDKHQLGRVAFYTYYPSGKLHKETAFDNKNGKLDFKFEEGYEYNDDGELIYKYMYTEIPSCQYPGLEETRYFYPSDTLTIIVETTNGGDADTTFIQTQKDYAGNIVLESERRKQRNRFDRNDETQYYYNKRKKITREITTDKLDGDIAQADYTYKGDRIKKYAYSDKNYHVKKKYKKNRLKTEESEYTGSPKRKKVFDYNKQGKEERSRLYENGKHTYTYLTSYNDRGLKSKYDMINESDGSSGIWLFEYDEAGKLIYKIDLYGRK